MLLVKLNHYGVCEVSNNWSKSYLSNHNQYASTSAYDSGHAAINCRVPHGSVLGSILFLIFINELDQAIKFCKVCHFADDTNLLCLSNFTKRLNKLVNADLKQTFCMGLICEKSQTPIKTFLWYFEKQYI